MQSNEIGQLQPEKIHILNVNILKCSIESPFEFSIKNIHTHDFTYKFEVAFNLEDLLIKTDFILNIATKSKIAVEEEAVGSFHFVFIFKIDNLKELAILNKNNTIDLGGGLDNAIASLTYSTSRGILLTRLKGTALENFMLPVIDPNQLINNSSLS